MREVYVVDPEFMQPLRGWSAFFFLGLAYRFS